MCPSTAQLWATQDKHPGDRWRLFQAVGEKIDAASVFYPGCYMDIAPSFVFRSVTYLDLDRRAPKFFEDRDGIRKIIADHDGPADPEFRFVHGDYTEPIDVAEDHFDLLVSLYAGFISEHCGEYLRVGGTLLVNSSHGDAAMAAIDPRFALSGVVTKVGDSYRVSDQDLDTFMHPKKSQSITVESLHASGRGIGYTKSPFAYLFTRVA